MMKASTKKWVVGAHILSASVWIGAVVVLFLLSLLSFWIQHPAQLVFLHDALRMIEYWMIIPPAFASLISGGLLSWKTKWGFFQFRWVTTKWIATVSLILFGALFLNTWIEGTAALSKQVGLASWQNPTYKLYFRLHMVFVPVQWLVLVGMLFLSVFKPWGKRSKK